MNSDIFQKQKPGNNFRTGTKAVLWILLLSNICIWIFLFSSGLQGKTKGNTGGSDYSNLSGGLGSNADQIVDHLENIFKSLQQVNEVELQFATEPTIYKVDTESNTIIADTGNVYYDSYYVSSLECKPGETYYYTGTHYNYAGQYSILVTDSDGTVLLKDLGGATDGKSAVDETDYLFVIPENGTRLYIQSYWKPVTLKKLSYRNIASEIGQIELSNALNYDNVVRSIQRIGDGMGYPSQSLDAFREAYKRGFRIFLCDLIFTSDNIPVCHHDSYLNQYYQNVYDGDGNLVSTDNPIYFSENTYETLSQYSYGAAGYPLLQFTDMLKLARQLGVELYVEVKGMNEEQAKIACDLVKEYGLADRTSWSGGVDSMTWIINNIETARVSTIPKTITDEVIAELNSLKTGKNKVFIFGWDTTVLTEEIVDKLIENDIAFEQGTPKTPQEVIDYFKRGDAYYYCTGIETNGFIAGKVLLENALKG